MQWTQAKVKANYNIKDRASISSWNLNIWEIYVSLPFALLEIAQFWEILCVLWKLQRSEKVAVFQGAIFVTKCSELKRR